MRTIAALGTAGLTAFAGTLALGVAGKLTVDLGWGRRSRRLGPQHVRIGAPRESVFDLIAVPYLAPNPPRDLREKIRVLDRGSDMVVAAHHTKVGRITAVTVESVSFARPAEIRFRLLRGPVPLVRERFALREVDGGRATELEYSGELATDLWSVGAAWGDLVARYWERAVADALAKERGIKAVMLNTNGIRLARDDAFLAELAGLRPHIYLQFDGFDERTHRTIRGRDLREIKQRALDRCAAAGLTVTLVAAIERGVNEHEVGEIVPDGRIIPFCAYNSVGYREQVRAQLSGTDVATVVPNAAPLAPLLRPTPYGTTASAPADATARDTRNVGERLDR